MSDIQPPNGEVQESLQDAAAGVVVREQAKVILLLLVDKFLDKRPTTALISSLGLSLAMVMDLFVAQGGPKDEERARFDEMNAFAEALPARIKELVTNGVMTRYGVTGERPS